VNVKGSFGAFFKELYVFLTEIQTEHFLNTVKPKATSSFTWSDIWHL